MKKTASAGGILVKLVQPEPLICLVKLPPNFEGYVFPKGHIESGETIEQTAIREVIEETGIKDITLKEYLGVVTRGATEKDGTQVSKDIHLYLMVTDDIKHGEADEVHSWLTLDQALENMVFKEEREFLLKNLSLIKQLSNVDK